MKVITYIIEFLFSAALLINAILFIPQAMKLYRNKDARNVSFITFFGFNLIQLAVVLHGFIKKDYILAYGTMLSLITCGSVTILVIFYKSKAKLRS